MRGHLGCAGTGRTDVAQGPLALDAQTWHMGPLALDIWDVAKRGDPDPLSRISKLVRWFDEDVGSKRVGVCNILSHGPRAQEIGAGYCSIAKNTVAS